MGPLRWWGCFLTWVPLLFSTMYTLPCACTNTAVCFRPCQSSLIWPVCLMALMAFIHGVSATMLPVT